MTSRGVLQIAVALALIGLLATGSPVQARNEDAEKEKPERQEPPNDSRGEPGRGRDDKDAAQPSPSNTDHQRSTPSSDPADERDESMTRSPSESRPEPSPGPRSSSEPISGEAPEYAQRTPQHRPEDGKNTTQPEPAQPPTGARTEPPYDEAVTILALSQPAPPLVPPDAAPAARTQAAPASTQHSTSRLSEGNAPWRPDPLTAHMAKARVENDDSSRWLIYFLAAGLSAVNALALMRQTASDDATRVLSERRDRFRQHIEEPFATYLVEFGIDSWSALRRADPNALAFWLGADRAHIDRWQAHAELMETLSLNDHALRLLANAGIASLRNLADGNADELWQQLRATGISNGFGVQDVHDWVRSAKEHVARRRPFDTA